MKYLIYTISIILVLGLNVGLFGNLQINGQIPDLPLLMVLFFALDKKNWDFFFVAFAGGIFLDCYSAGFFGGFTLAFLVLALICHLLVSNLMVLELTWKNLVLLVFGALIVVDFCLWFYSLAAFKLGLSPDYSGLRVYADAFLPQLFYNLLLFYPTRLLCDFIKKTVENFTIRRRSLVR